MKSTVLWIQWSWILHTSSAAPLFVSTICRQYVTPFPHVPRLGNQTSGSILPGDGKAAVPDLTFLRPSNCQVNKQPEKIQIRILSFHLWCSHTTPRMLIKITASQYSKCYYTCLWFCHTGATCERGGDNHSTWNAASCELRDGTQSGW